MKHVGVLGLQRVHRGLRGRRRARLIGRARTHTDSRYRGAAVIQRAWRAYRQRVRREAARLVRIRVWTNEHAVRMSTLRRKRLIAAGAAARLQIWWWLLRRRWAAVARGVWAAQCAARFGQTHWRRRRARAVVAARRVSYRTAARAIRRVWRRHCRVTLWRTLAWGALRDARAELLAQWGMWYERRDAFNTFTPQERAAMYIQGAWRRHAEHAELMAGIAQHLAIERAARDTAAAAVVAPARAALAAERPATAALVQTKAPAAAVVAQSESVLGGPTTEIVASALAMVPAPPSDTSVVVVAVTPPPTAVTVVRCRGSTISPDRHETDGEGSTALVLLSGGDGSPGPGSAGAPFAAPVPRPRLMAVLPTTNAFQRPLSHVPAFCSRETLLAEPLDTVATGASPAAACA